MLLVFAMNCCTKMHCPLLINITAAYFLHSPVCLPHLLICRCLISSPNDCPPSCVMLMFFFSSFFVTCYISLWLHFGLFVYIFSLSFFIQLLWFCLMFCFDWCSFHFGCFVSETVLPLFFAPDAVMAKKILPLSELESCGNSNSLHRIWAN